MNCIKKVLCSQAVYLRTNETVRELFYTECSVDVEEGDGQK